jgi:hypothetical protein
MAAAAKRISEIKKPLTTQGFLQYLDKRPGTDAYFHNTHLVSALVMKA